MKLTILGGVVFVAAITAGLAAQAPDATTERTIMGCVKGDGTEASPWTLTGVIIPVPPPAAAPGGGGGGRGGGGRAARRAAHHQRAAAPAGGRRAPRRAAAAAAWRRRRGGGGAPPAGGAAPAAGACGRRTRTRRSWGWWWWRRSWRRTGGSPASASASAELQADRHQHDAVGERARRGHRRGHEQRLQGRHRALDVGRRLPVVGSFNASGDAPRSRFSPPSRAEYCRKVPAVPKPWRRVLAIGACVLLMAVASLAQFGGRGRFIVRRNAPYDGRFTFVRVSYTTAPGGYWYGGGWPAWGHGTRCRNRT